MKTLRRYPGASPFNSSQEKIFFGRDKDIGRLLTMIQVERKVLLYSRSGLGKTSLLEAGVLPKLPENYQAVSIRLYAWQEGAESPVQRVIKALISAIPELETTDDTIIDKIAANSREHKTLWYYLKKAQLLAARDAETEQPKTFLLFFDQFEELFSFPEKEIEEFKDQIFELSSHGIPNRFALLVSRSRDSLAREELALMRIKPEKKLVFAIRSDRLSLLNRLSDKIPDIQTVFYELLPLTVSQARDAIVKPAADTSPEFETPAFSYEEDAVSKILHELSDGGNNHVETTQLQIVCHRIEEIAEAKPQPVAIGLNDLPEFKNIFLNFYNGSVSRLTPDKHDNARRLIEDQLIRNGQRISLDEEICKEYLDSSSLKTLVDTHLLRAEQNSFGRFSFEISHDTLVEPILESQKAYKARLEIMRLEKEREEELQKINEQREKERLEQEAELKRVREEQERKEEERLRELKQQRKITRLVSMFLLISLGLIIYGLFQRQIAKKQMQQTKLANEVAFKAKEEALQSLEKLQIAEFVRNYDAGLVFEENADYREAYKSFVTALRFRDSLDVHDRIVSNHRLALLKETHQNYMDEARQKIAMFDFIGAMEIYNKGTENVLIQEARRDLHRQAMAVFRKDLNDYRLIPDAEMEKITLQRISRLETLFNEGNMQR
jgi:hypothetical protein